MFTLNILLASDVADSPYEVYRPICIVFYSKVDFYSPKSLLLLDVPHYILNICAFVQAIS